MICTHSAHCPHDRHVVGMQPSPLQSTVGGGGRQGQAEAPWSQGGRQTLLEAGSAEAAQSEVTGCDRGASQ